MKTRYRPPSDCVFPNRCQTELLVTSSRLELAKPYAVSVIKTHSQKLQRHFSRFATRKYRCKPQQVSFDTDAQLKRLRAATLEECPVDVCGETDGQRIWVSPNVPMSFDELVGVLVHEFMHNYCNVRGTYRDKSRDDMMNFKVKQG